MSTKSNKQVIRDERDAEKLYKAHIAQAAILARNLAEDEARTEAARVAAAEAEAALLRIEEARRRAEQHKKPEVVKRTFWSWLTGA